MAASFYVPMILGTVRRERQSAKVARFVLARLSRDGRFEGKISRSDALRVLKNALDSFLPEYRRKPVEIVAVSAGGFGGVTSVVCGGDFEPEGDGRGTLKSSGRASGHPVGVRLG